MHIKTDGVIAVRLHTTSVSTSAVAARSAKACLKLVRNIAFYPPGRGICFTVCFFCFSVFLFGQRFLDNPQANSRQSLHAGVLWFRVCLLPFWGLLAPGEPEKGGNEIFVTIGVNGEFLHFGGF